MDTKKVLYLNIDNFKITNIRTLDNGGFLYFNGGLETNMSISITNTDFINILSTTYQEDEGYSQIKKYYDETIYDNSTWYVNTLNKLNGGGIFSISSYFT